jgi:hypothetical protein
LEMVDRLGNLRPVVFVTEAELTRDVELERELARGRIRDVHEPQELPIPGASGAFRDVAAHRHGGSAHLVHESETLGHRERARQAVDGDGRVGRQSRDAELSLISHGGKMHPSDPADTSIYRASDQTNAPALLVTPFRIAQCANRIALLPIPPDPVRPHLLLLRRAL